MSLAARISTGPLAAPCSIGIGALMMNPMRIALGGLAPDLRPLRPSAGSRGGARREAIPARPRLGAAPRPRGYRYPQAGWIVLHIEGEPYERGYQHGRLLAPEIAGLRRRCFAAMRSRKAPADALAATCARWSTPCSCAGSTRNTSRR